MNNSTCKSSGEDTSCVVCENEMVNLTCNQGMIKVTTATYGRTQRSICHHPHIRATDCGETDNVLDKVVQKCDGLETCSLRASNDEFGRDPCPGTYKYLNYSYNCLPYRASVGFTVSRPTTRIVSTPTELSTIEPSTRSSESSTYNDKTIDMLSSSMVTESLTISERIDNIDGYILQAMKENLTLTEIITLTKGILNDTQVIIDDIFSNDIETVDLRRFTKTLLTMVERLGMLILTRLTSGRSAVALQTSSLDLNVEKNSFQNLCDTIVMVDPYNGFEIPKAEHVIPHVGENVTGSRLVRGIL
ncbi:uncharacterized protein [Ptychodera flava]|uniref:uncharacterized protein isoform X2 n=1 Tax=Ptychodera flava TaxID=63121 RepID=UPI00396A6BEC